MGYRCLAFSFDVAGRYAEQRVVGIKDSHFFVPYDGTLRNYEVSVYAEGSTKVRSIDGIESQEGRITATSNFSINGYNCYDIKKTPYDKDVTSPTTAYGRWESRTALNSPAPDPQFSYSVLGSGTLTYAWTIFDPDTILTDIPTTAFTAASIDIQFKSWILEDDWLVNQPTHERIVVLTCVVTDGGSCKYVVSKEIKIGDRDCCARLTDVDGIIYSAVRFGTAGCWMTENLAVTKNQKQSVQLYPDNPSSGDTRYDPRYTFHSTKTGTHSDPTLLTIDQAKNSNFYDNNEGKPGLLYNWAAAIGAEDGGTGTNPRGARNTTAYPNKSALGTSTNDASRDASKYEDICPVGWYLPSDKEWSFLEQEITAHYTQYSMLTGMNTWTDSNGTYRNDVSPGHGEAMRNSKDIGSAQSPAGRSKPKESGFSALLFVGMCNRMLHLCSKPKESGFSALLVGYAFDGNWRDYGSYTPYWSSSSDDGMIAWGRALNSANAGVHRNYFYYKYYLSSVRCKKLD